VAITLPQMPLSEIDGVVNLFSAQRAKEKHLIFGTCWQDCLRGAKSNFWGVLAGLLGVRARCSAKTKIYSVF
jgi:hypothetical protein